MDWSKVKRQSPPPDAPVRAGLVQLVPDISQPVASAARDKLYKLEAVRGLAAVYVVVHHTVPNHIIFLGQDIGRLARFGQEAVILFFLLSGFVIQLSFLKSRDKSFTGYFLKRFYRIYIPLLVVFAIGYLSKSFNAGFLVDPQWGNMLGNLLMLQDWIDAKPNVIVGPYLSNGPLWSLAYEWWFYMLFFPVVSLVPDDRQRDILIYGTAVFAALLYVAYPLFVLRIFMYLAIWWTGAFAARLYLDGKLTSLRSMRTPALVLLTICVVLSVDVLIDYRAGGRLLMGYHPLVELRHFVFALIALLLAFVWRQLRWWGFDWLVAPFLVFAPVSYVIYIAHYHVFTDATYLDFIPSPLVRWFAYFAVLLFVAFVIELKLYPALKGRLLAPRPVGA